jgi:hypothetical protein
MPGPVGMLVFSYGGVILVSVILANTTIRRELIPRADRLLCPTDHPPPSIGMALVGGVNAAIHPRLRATDTGDDVNHPAVIRATPKALVEHPDSEVRSSTTPSDRDPRGHRTTTTPAGPSGRSGLKKAPRASPPPASN